MYPPALDLDAEDADTDYPDGEVELRGGWDGSDLVEDVTIEVGGREGLVYLFSRPAASVCPHGRWGMVDRAAFASPFCGVGPGGRGHGLATGDAGRPTETQDGVFIPQVLQRRSWWRL